MNPKKLGKIDNHRQEPWKAPLPVFIQNLYFERFGKERPDEVMSIEDRVKQKKDKQRERKARKAAEEGKTDPCSESSDPF